MERDLAACAEQHRKAARSAELKAEAESSRAQRRCHDVEHQLQRVEGLREASDNARVEAKREVDRLQVEVTRARNAAADMESQVGGEGPGHLAAVYRRRSRPGCSSSPRSAESILGLQVAKLKDDVVREQVALEVSQAALRDSKVRLGLPVAVLPGLGPKSLSSSLSSLSGTGLLFRTSYHAAKAALSPARTTSMWA